MAPSVGAVLFLVVGCVAHRVADHQPALDLDCGLRVVGLLEAVRSLHHAALGVGEVVLVLGPRAFARRLGLASARLFARRLLSLSSLAPLRCKGDEFLPVALFGPRLNDSRGFAQLLDALAPTGDLAGHRQPVVEWRAVGRVGLGEQLRDLLLQQHHLLERMAVAHRAVLARAGENLRPVQRQSHLAHAQHAHARRSFEHLMKAPFQERATFAPERADAVVIGMLVRAQQPHRDILVREPLDAPAAEGARRVAVDEQPEHHRGRVLLAAGAAVVDARRAQVQQPNRIHDEVDQMILRHPVAQIRRQEHRRVVVNVDEAGRHPGSTHQIKNSGAQSPTGC
jgi:hypothetical protein